MTPQEEQELRDQVKQLRDQQAHQSEALYALAKINRGYVSDQVIQDLLSHVNALNNGVYVFPPKVEPLPSSGEVFGVWNGASFAGSHDGLDSVWSTVIDLAEPYPDRDLEFYPKAGEGGEWIARKLHPEWGDPSDLAIDNPDSIVRMVQAGEVHGIRVVPYYVIRGRADWVQGEYRNIRDIAIITRRVILNLEVGRQYWNGSKTRDGVNQWWDGLRAVVPEGTVLEIACIPRPSVMNELGGMGVLQTWIDRADRVSWECYDGVASDLGPGALNWVRDTFGPLPPEKLIPIVQRNRTRTWIETFKLGTPEIQVWYLDGNW